ncbi:organic cation carnitine transporter 3-like [Olea europaea subsp. europaea]|uniref:Organic cation carnitine transporter 3-like n=1 Tax=Olea europaea subsp. europaea TaxID=158383 RepID=A0A8S0VJ06_OLEEU|nr:organic cation carnitine transporter 3-like [Olea europaea subsp. europaea]
MTDPNPLPRDTPESESPRIVEQQLSLDDTIERCIGNCGRIQFFQATLISFAYFFDAQQCFISVFTDAEPTWHCNSLSNSPCKNICRIPRDSWNWDLPAHTSIISEWSLECSGSVITGLLASTFYLGCLVGGFVLSTLADSSLGRKNMLVLSCLLMSVSGVLTALSTNVWMYTAFRFISGFGRSTITTCALVLSTELVGKKWRGNVGIIGFICFPIGFLSLPGIAYLTKGSSWRLLYMWTCVPAVVYSVLSYFLVCESPRWLYIKGRKEDFAKTLRSISAPANRSSLTNSFFDKCIKWEDEWLETDLYSTIKILLQKSWTLRRLASVMVVGFGVGMSYYGMPLGLGNLAFDLYWSVVFNAFIEIPSTLLIFFLIGKLNRKFSILGLAILSGIFSLTCVLVRWKGMQIGLELISFFSAVTALDLVMIYTLELFPTCVRNSAVSMLRQAVLFGGLFGPVIAAAGRQNRFLSYGVFGITIAVCGLFVTLLPETRGRTFYDTIDEEERKNRALIDGVDTA